MSEVMRLVAKWRHAAMLANDYETDVAIGFQQCANELEAALTAQQPVGGGGVREVLQEMRDWVKSAETADAGPYSSAWRTVVVQEFIAKLDAALAIPPSAQPAATICGHCGGDVLTGCSSCGESDFYTVDKSAQAAGEEVWALLGAIDNDCEMIGSDAVWEAKEALENALRNDEQAAQQPVGGGAVAVVSDEICGIPVPTWVSDEAQASTPVGTKLYTALRNDEQAAQAEAAGALAGEGRAVQCAICRKSISGSCNKCARARAALPAAPVAGEGAECPKCSGLGRDCGVACPRCEGDGVVPVKRGEGSDSVEERPCPDCAPVATQGGDEVRALVGKLREWAGPKRTTERGEGAAAAFREAADALESAISAQQGPVVDDVQFATLALGYMQRHASTAILWVDMADLYLKARDALAHPPQDERKGEGK